jgi:glutathione S-transferase
MPGTGKPLALISHMLCPYVQRAVIALNEKKADFERIDIDMSAKPDWFLGLSPTGKTPLLRVGDEAIFESSVICEYLEDTIAPALHPADPLLRARHRAWMEFASGMLGLNWTLQTSKDEAAFDGAVKTLRERFVQIENVLGQGPYFSGAQFSLADAAFGPVLRFFDVFNKVLGEDLFDSTPKVAAWRKALMQRPSVKHAVVSDYNERLQKFIIGHAGLMGQRLQALA